MKELAIFLFDPGSSGSQSKDSLPPPGVVSPCGTNPHPVPHIPADNTFRTLKRTLQG